MFWLEKQPSVKNLPQGEFTRKASKSLLIQPDREAPIIPFDCITLAGLCRPYAQHSLRCVHRAHEQHHLITLAAFPLSIIL